MCLTRAKACRAMSAHKLFSTQIEVMGVQHRTLVTVWKDRQTDTRMDRQLREKCGWPVLAVDPLVAGQATEKPISSKFLKFPLLSCHWQNPSKHPRHSTCRWEQLKTYTRSLVLQERVEGINKESSQPRTGAQQWPGVCHRHTFLRHISCR